MLFENVSRKFEFHFNLTRLTGTLPEDLHTFMIISGSILLRMRNVLDKVAEKIKIHVSFMFNKFFSRKSCSLRANVAKYGAAGQATDDCIIRRMRFDCCINKATNTRSEYVILIACPR